MPVVTKRVVDAREMRDVSPVRNDRFGEVPVAFPSAKAACLWVARRTPQPFTGRDIDVGLTAIDYPHKNHTVHSSLHALKQSGDIRDVPGTVPLQYYVNDPDMKLLEYQGDAKVVSSVAPTSTPVPAPAQPTKDPLPRTNGVAAQTQATPSEVTPIPTLDVPSAPEPTTYLLTEAIEQLIVKIAEMQQPQSPQITLQVELGEAARTKIAALEEEIRTWVVEVTSLESRLALKTQQCEEIQAVAIALQNRIDTIRHSVGLGETDA